MTEQCTEEKLIKELNIILVACRRGDYNLGSVMGRREASRQIHELYKKYTYLKGDEELPQGLLMAISEIKARGFKSIKEWKKEAQREKKEEYA